MENIKQEESVEFVLILPARNQTQQIKVKQENVEEVNDKFVCKVCDKKFNTKNNFKSHQRSHEDKIAC
jgi:competence CoiA-like predicted nuclease